MSRYSSGFRLGDAAARPLSTLLVAALAATAVAAGTVIAQSAAAPAPSVHQSAGDVGWNIVGPDSGRVH